MPPERGTIRRELSGDADLALALLDASDDAGAFAEAGELFFDGGGEGGPGDEAVADAHIEDSAHLVGIDAAVFLEEVEDGVGSPSGVIEDRIDLGVEGAGEVCCESAAGDMGHAGDDFFDFIAAEDLDDGSCVEPGWVEEDVAEGALWVEIGVDEGEVEAGVSDDSADEGVSVAVGAVGFESDDDIAGLDACGIGDAGEFDDTDRETGEVDIVGGVDLGHFGGFASEESGAAVLAGVGDASDDGFESFGEESSAGDVVEEDEGFASLDHEVVDAHGDEVDADGVEPVEIDGEADFGSHAVGTGDEDGVLEVSSED